ncbi:MAG: methyltransferase domain-containing protein [Betaproteobacteria bacterium]|nr:methyltransferase domain-containing protein [Betaproteobacteria bacterium]
MQAKYSLMRRRVVIALGALPLARLAAASEDIEDRRTGGPYVPTPQIVVDEMLRFGRVGADDFVVDLGSGDGVIVLTAAQKLKARGFGVDIDPELVEQSNAAAKLRGVADRAAFYVQDVFKADISKATVVTLYLLPDMMLDLRPKILGELKPGTRVVSHDYHFGDWQPDDEYTWDVPEKEAVNGVPRATVYLWLVPARVAGRWRLNVAPPAGQTYELTLKQSFQNLDGSVTGGGAKAVKLTQSRLQGEEISFAFPSGGDRHLFRGRVAGGTMEGTVQLAGGKGSARWTATRVRA